MYAFLSLEFDLKNQLVEERGLRKSTECKLKSLQEKLDYADLGRFGKKIQKVRKETLSGEPEKQKPDRNREKDDLTERIYSVPNRLITNNLMFSKESV